MLIRFGYELTFNCAEPTLMVCLLDAHHDHARNIRFETPFETTPVIPTDVYLDTWQWCPPVRSAAGEPDRLPRLDHRGQRPARFSQTRRGGDRGRPAAERYLGLHARQPLLRNRQAHGHCLAIVWIDAAWLAPRPGNLRFRLRSSHLRLSICPRHAHRA